MTTGSSSTPRAIMSVWTSEKYEVRSETSWWASSTRSPRPSCSTAALLIAYGIVPMPLMKVNTELISTIWPRLATTDSIAAATV
jgi:hypothetical protein